MPIYEQLCKKIQELIIKGVLAENDQLPSVRALAKDLGVNPNTVSKAYTELERNRIIYSVTGRGSFVAAVDQTNLRENILAEFEKAASDALKAGISAVELKQKLDRIIKETDKENKRGEDL